MILAATKILGTAATGLWAAYSLQVAENLAPGLAVFGCAPGILGRAPAAPVPAAVARSSALSGLSGAASAFFILGYLLSPPSGRHPYLLYGAIGAPLVGLLQYSGAQDLEAQEGAAAAATDATEDEVSQLTGSVYEKVEAGDAPAAAATDADATDATPALLHKATLYTRAVALLSSGIYLLTLVGLAGDSL